MKATFPCPHCGTQVPADAAACPECGSDNETGWSRATVFDDWILPDDEPLPQERKPATWPQYALVAVALVTIAALLAYVLPWGIYLAPVLIAGAGLAYYVMRSRPLQRRREEQAAYQRLLQKARGDQELVERLIEYERRRSPGADRLKWMQDVLYYWERDSR